MLCLWTCISCWAHFFEGWQVCHEGWALLRAGVVEPNSRCRPFFSLHSPGNSKMEDSRRIDGSFRIMLA